MLLPRSFEEDGEEFFAGAAAGLDRVAVGAEGDHLSRIVATAEGQVVYVVDLQDWLSTDSKAEGVGGFVEAERMAPDDADAQAIQAKLATLIESLGAETTRTTETYDSLVHAAQDTLS